MAYQVLLSLFFIKVLTVDVTTSYWICSIKIVKKGLWIRNILIWGVECRLRNNKRLDEQKAAVGPLVTLVTRAVTQFGNGLIDSSPFRPDGASSHYRAQVLLLSGYLPPCDRSQWYRLTFVKSSLMFVPRLIVFRKKKKTFFWSDQYQQCSCRLHFNDFYCCFFRTDVLSFINRPKTFSSNYQWFIKM